MSTSTRRATAAGIGLTLALGLAACGDDGDDVGATGEPETTTTTAESTTSTTGATTTTAATAPDGAAAEAAVAAWLAALGTGDLDGAWALTHPASQEAFGGRAAFDGMASALAEGYGAWSGSTDATFTAVPLDDVAPDLAVVVVEGTVGKEGPPVPGADALVVRAEGGDALVDPFHQVLDGQVLEWDPPAGTAVAPQGPLSVLLPSGREVWFLLDAGAPAPPSSEEVVGDRTRASFAPATPLAPGRHSLAVVVVRDGIAQAQAVTYAVEG